ncbi:MAG: hypothetical protein WDN26_02815 [Chitinophagaceae bacterium]
MAQAKNLFWLVPVDKAAKQIIRALEKKKTKSIRQQTLVADRQIAKVDAVLDVEEDRVS